MSVEIFDIEQCSPEWFRIRAGLPTASEFATIMAVGRNGGESKERRTYLLKLAGELISGEPMENYSNGYMERGKAMEAEARDLYAFTHAVEPQRVGFIRNGNKGYSPDALIGKDGALEIKTKAPHILIELLIRNEFPPAHLAQCQGGLWVAEREWIDLVCYYRGVPQFEKRIYRDDGYIKKLAAAVDMFNEELAMVVDWVRRKGIEEAA